MNARFFYTSDSTSAAAAACGVAEGPKVDSEPRQLRERLSDRVSARIPPPLQNIPNGSPHRGLRGTRQRSLYLASGHFQFSSALHLGRSLAPPVFGSLFAQSHRSWPNRAGRGISPGKPSERNVLSAARVLRGTSSPWKSRPANPLS